MPPGSIPILVVLFILILASLKIIQQYERGLKFTFSMGADRHNWEFEAYHDGWKFQDLPISKDQGWAKYVGCKGRSVSIEHYGASGKGTVLFKEFGLTSDAVVAAAKESLEGLTRGSDCL